jgi:tRNA pseudouridine38-40 synthase
MRWKCVCSYDGTDFHGWQSQPCGGTIQDTLESRLEFIFGRSIRVHGSGRTDAGVHASGQVFHFDGDWQLGEARLIGALNCGIPKAIRVLSAEHVADTFHARFSALRKRYEYRMVEGMASPFNYRHVHCLGRMRPDVDAMNAVAENFLGTHDFSAFGASGGGGGNPVKTLLEASFLRDGWRLTFTTEGSGYLYKMVRIVAGCMLQVGLGNLSASDVIAPLLGNSSAANGGVAVERLRRECLPARGLFLEKVYYGHSAAVQPPSGP